MLAGGGTKPIGTVTEDSEPHCPGRWPWKTSTNIWGVTMSGAAGDWEVDDADTTVALVDSDEAVTEVVLVA